MLVAETEADSRLHWLLTFTLSDIKDTRLRIFNLYQYILNLQKVHYDTLKVLIEHLAK